MLIIMPAYVEEPIHGSVVAPDSKLNDTCHVAEKELKKKRAMHKEDLVDDVYSFITDL